MLDSPHEPTGPPRIGGLSTRVDDGGTELSVDDAASTKPAALRGDGGPQVLSPEALTALAGDLVESPPPESPRPENPPEEASGV